MTKIVVTIDHQGKKRFQFGVSPVQSMPGASKKEMKKAHQAHFYVLNAIATFVKDDAADAIVGFAANSDPALANLMSEADLDIQNEGE